MFSLRYVVLFLTTLSVNAMQYRAIGHIVPKDDPSKPGCPLPIPRFLCCYATKYALLLRQPQECFKDTIYVSTLDNIVRYATHGTSGVSVEDSSAYSLAKHLLFAGSVIAVAGDPASDYIVFNRNGMCLHVPPEVTLADVADLPKDLNINDFGSLRPYVTMPYLFVSVIDDRRVPEPKQWRPRVCFKPDVSHVLVQLRLAK